MVTSHHPIAVEVIILRENALRMQPQGTGLFHTSALLVSTEKRAFVSKTNLKQKYIYDAVEH